MIRMAAQIADGMAFLEYNKFIHRDLAARNCMVADDMTVKIGDFGMSRQIYTGNYYRKGGKGEMPIRWMAPESLGEGIFTSQSDVWSYGVVIWEIMMLGAQPYADMGNNEVMAHVLDGNLLNLPICCPDVLSGIVRLCWNWTSSQRPRFLKIVETLDAYLDDNFRLGYSGFGPRVRASGYRFENPFLTLFRCRSADRFRSITAAPGTRRTTRPPTNR